MQVDCAVAPWYFPATQAVQPAEPVFFWKVPTLQSMHATAPMAEYLPRSQFVQAEAPVAEYMPAEHDAHPVEPVAEA